MKFISAEFMLATLNPSSKCFDEHEVQQLTNALEKEPLRFKVLVMLALITGMRRGELVGLEWKHVDLNEGIIHIKQSHTNCC
ncbi:tyrosine-type recombinase/integrase [Paenibacillus larvae]